MVLIQAMACGVPVIATRSGAIPEFVPEDEAGILIEEGSISELSVPFGDF